jgi:hypothetical protein
MFHKLQELEENKVISKVTDFVASFCSHSVQGEDVDQKGMFKLAESLKSNTSLTSLSLYSSQYRE